MTPAAKSLWRVFPPAPLPIRRLGAGACVHRENASLQIVPSVSLRSVKAPGPEIPYRKDRQDLGPKTPPFAPNNAGDAEHFRETEKTFADPISRHRRSASSSDMPFWHQPFCANLTSRLLLPNWHTIEQTEMRGFLTAIERNMENGEGCG